MNDLIRHIRSRYLELLERSILNSIYGERLEMMLKGLLQRLRHPYLTRRGAISWPSRAHSMIGEHPDAKCPRAGRTDTE